MWLNDELLNNMFVDRVKNQQEDLQKARARNADLNRKYEELQTENKSLHDKLHENEIDSVTGKNDLNYIENELIAQRKLHMELTQRLRIYNEEINLLNQMIAETNDSKHNSQMELKPISESLGFKSNVVDCLEKKMIETRLNNAEQDEIIMELQRSLHSLEIEVEAMKGVKPASVCNWQQEFLDAKIKEADEMIEFNKIRRSLAELKSSVQRKYEETEQDLEDSSGDFFSLKFNLRDKYIEELRREEEISLANTVALQDELDNLKMQEDALISKEMTQVDNSTTNIDQNGNNNHVLVRPEKSLPQQVRKLESKKANILNQIHLNEEDKVHLHNMRTKMLRRYTNIVGELEAEKDKYKRFEESTNQELDDILRSVTDKTVDISKLNEKIKDIKIRNESILKQNLHQREESDEETIRKLRRRIEVLTERTEKLNQIQT